MSSEPTPQFESNLRKVPREIVAASAAIRGDGIRIVADVVNLSQQGAGLRTSEPLDVGTRVRFKLPLVQQAIAARVVWVGDCEVGCAFDEPLHAGLFEQLKRAVT